jgi:hypothetical protein
MRHCPWRQSPRIDIIASRPTEWAAFLKKSKSKNYQDGKDKEDDRPYPVISGSNLCVHGTIPLKASITFLVAIAQLPGAVCHTDVTPRRLMCVKSALHLTVPTEFSWTARSVSGALLVWEFAIYSIPPGETE